ncbi:hypothetical protein BJV85_002761 [Clostridium acetobutylicum]|uniref:Spore coat associated protein JA (CotJA) n=1 Tax=Clostridium acetobutylicum (strain ATCC 824 / DSM 792 / JCM 1419 / IAM 19013 / LMG 5710 / NBRC 13948 / NRRL B-527 / VKM B-1787 / 2291 / W) TaxID=272562 RepID=Q97JN7_CLOAB|nr:MULTISPECIES: hypothetical protein [Clostridium]AAK79208.1 Hypothetical protein CA_C1236 [Clostridium acetobutylicum ATCC 824]ADZ20287.1 Conserved hypothetical protein [Clostridium acetobutylicum EA 2018]AEI31730.1 hypothetical protein SMB_G1257 [Clostridium acetobutylicum DSM 1731]AWV81543.1 hypothetical protein DK921_15865 [Clostridium acetobutylicum]KHD35110.1 hypothetical protein NL50_14525 [Clostridium acetobutylicum]
MDYYENDYENNMNYMFNEPCDNCFYGFNPYRESYKRAYSGFSYYRAPFGIPNFKEVSEEELFD